MKDATSRRKLWVPGTVTLVGNSAQVFGGDRIEEFRLHRLIWMGPESFLITGLDAGSKFKRVHLRLANHDEAVQVASTIVRRTGIREEPLFQAEEIRVEARFLMSRRALLIQMYVFSIRLFIYGFVFLILSEFGPVGLILGATQFGILVALWVWGSFQRTRRRVEDGLG